MADAVFSFGKHRGKTFQHVFEHDKGYAKWALALPSVNGQLTAFIDFCKASGSQPGAPAPHPHPAGAGPDAALAAGALRHGAAGASCYPQATPARPLGQTPAPGGLAGVSASGHPGGGFAGAYGGGSASGFAGGALGCGGSQQTTAYGASGPAAGGSAGAGFAGGFAVGGGFAGGAGPRPEATAAPPQPPQAQPPRAQPPQAFPTQGQAGLAPAGQALALEAELCSATEFQLCGSHPGAPAPHPHPAGAGPGAALAAGAPGHGAAGASCYPQATPARALGQPPAPGGLASASASGHPGGGFAGTYGGGFADGFAGGALGCGGSQQTTAYGAYGAAAGGSAGAGFAVGGGFAGGAGPRPEATAAPPQPLQAQPPQAQPPQAFPTQGQAALAPAGQAFALEAELCSATEFQLCGSHPGAFVPQSVWQALTRLPGVALSETKRQWRFPLAQYDEVLRLVRSTPALAACELETVPDWVVQALLHAQQTVVRHENDAMAKLQSFLEALPPEVAEERPVMPFQKEGIRFGIARGGRCLLGDEMGLGKTLQALAIIDQYREEWPVLVVAPSALRLVWRDQALAWLPHVLTASAVQVVSQGKQHVDPNAKLVITSYDLLARNQQFHTRADGQSYKVLIVDEAHFIKEQKSKRTQVVLQLCRDATRCVLISGTPAVNRAVELFTTMQALLPADLAPSFARYVARYCERQESNIRGHRIIKWVGAHHKSELNTLLVGTFMVRRLKRDVLKQLPSKRRQRITLDSSKLDSDKMKQVKRFVGTSAFTKFGEAEGGGGAPGDATEVTEAFKLTAEAKVDGVAEYVEYLLSNELKFLIFAHHHSMLNGIEEKLKAWQANYIRIDGHTPQQKRGDLVDRFQKNENVRVALLSITACGQGLTLTAAHTVVFAELYWVPGQMLQAEDRVHRIGQEHMVDIHYCIAEGSLDEIVFMSLNKKCKTTTGILDGVERCMDAWKQSAAPSCSSQSPSKRPCPRPAEPHGIAKFFKPNEG